VTYQEGWCGTLKPAAAFGSGSPPRPSFARYLSSSYSKGERMRKILIMLSILLLISCAAEKKPTLVDPSVRINNVKGISILPPQEQGWTIVRLNETQAVFGKKGLDSSSSYIVGVTVFRLPKFGSEEQYLQYVSKMKATQQPAERFRAIQNNYEICPDQSTYCVQHHEIVEDKKAKTPIGKQSMILEAIGKTIQHPKNSSIGVDFGYTYRYPSGGEDPMLNVKAEAFLKSVQFTDF
jgi:hypothetical protein